jgi:hypothetical protein
MQNVMKVLWKIIENSPDNKEKMQAIEHDRQCWMDMIVLLHPGGDMLEQVVARENKRQYQQQQQRQPLIVDGGGNGEA